ncbi:D-alanyl-D-alanine carboxypeptidase/D-alanyl-D-alanine endopeptidase [Riemerella columbina]|uniref:D-alanyl-D-alanine carboxypeptidase/D-alanyl-D-alanine endopeptidase n=1 Tax=Riemerella columbina TaxID=103810 RepID=UPI00266ED9DB|nr:D-alanyl-D-alanine carboxypeptidase/D-alanyl-D-alanine-endopeptidase [Riemerella columbina]WKS94596.1 D-alanyl-D-alanine carboxypeptidase/D-alanyl-D-alanine-endopeptidase [Riemerella columbina]
MNLIRKSLLALHLSLFAFTYTQTTQYPTYAESRTESVQSSAKQQVDYTIERLLDDPMLRNAQWGFVIYDPKKKQVISAYNEDTPLVPASTTKLLTTNAAMSIMGTKFRYNTQLEYSGNINNGVLEGNLYLVGSGDPTIGTGLGGSSKYTPIIMDYIYAIRDAGITKITGDIYVQTAVFKENKIDLPANIVWLEHNNYYLPVGSTQGINPRNEKSIIKQKNPFNQEKRFFYISPYTKKTVYTDTFLSNEIQGKVPDAPYYLANTLRASLLKNGISVLGTVQGKSMDINPEERFILTTYKSPKMEEIVYFTNQTSNNRFAEALLRSAGFYKNGDESLDTGRYTVEQVLREGGYDFYGLNLMDGSGLSRSNLVTPISQVKFLAGVMNADYFPAYFDSLPIAGQTGTLKSMFKYNDGYGQIFAKTGTLRAVKCLAGYIKTNTGKTLTFSLLINNYSGSVAQIKSKMEYLLQPALGL